MEIVSAKEQNEITVEFCGTAEMAADGLTKGLTPPILKRMRDLWGMVAV